MTASLRQTEIVRPDFAGIDTWPDQDILNAFLAGQQRAIDAVRQAGVAVAAAATEIARRLQAGGTLYYAGAGSSIRIAVQDGTELPATFGISESQLDYLIAGGRVAMFDTLAEKEDSAENGRAAAMVCGSRDVMLAVAASGRTPFTCAAAETAKARGSYVIAVVNVTGSVLGKVADLEVVLATGPEVIAGSTRMGAGTAQKVALNLISSLVGIKLGAVHDGMMVAMRPENEKLRERAMQIISQVSGVSSEAAKSALNTAGEIKPAILLCRGASSNTQANDLLAAAGGNLRTAMRQLEENQKPSTQH